MTKELSIVEVSAISKNIPSWVLRTYDSLADSRNTGKTSLKFEIDATHSGRVTNGRIYPGKKMRAAASSWYSQEDGGTGAYNKPVFKHHDDMQDPIGRVKKAKFIALKHNDDFSLDYKNPDEKGAGSGFIRLTVDISDSDAIEKILDGRLETVSSRQSTNAMYCNICDKEKVDMFRAFFGGDEEDEEDMCKHKVGETYDIKTADGKKQKMTARIYTGDLTYHEVSFVGIPGDSYAKVVRSTITADSKDSAEPKTVAVVESGSEIMLHDFRILDSLGNPIKAVEKKVTEIITVPAKKNKTNAVLTDSTPVSTEIKTVEDQKVGPEPIVTTQLNDDAHSEQNNRRTDGMTKVADLVSFSADDAKKLLDNQIKLSETLEASLADKVKEAKELSDTLSSRNATIADLQSKLEASQKDAVDGLAGIVVACHVLLDRKSVIGVSTIETYQEAVKQYSKRTLDSLRDSLNDSIAELLDKVLEKSTANKRDTKSAVTADEIVAKEKIEPKVELNAKSETTNGALKDSLINFNELVAKYSSKE